MSESADPDWLDFWRMERSVLRRVCLRWTRGNAADADDLLSEACLKYLWSSQRLFGTKPDNTLGWWTTIIANLARDRFRSETHRARLRDQQSALYLPHSGMAGESRVVARQALGRTLARTASLTAAQQYALISRTMGDSYSDVAQTLGTSAQNARKIVQQARSRLRVLERERAKAPEGTR